MKNLAPCCNLKYRDTVGKIAKYLQKLSQKSPALYCKKMSKNFLLSNLLPFCLPKIFQKIQMQVFYRKITEHLTHFSHPVRY